jgi:predicted DNA-binding transcriptional regulator AlpA
MSNTCSNEASATAPPEPLLFDAAMLARLTGRSVRSVWRDLSAGRIPSPVRIGGAVRWRRGDILAWVAAGCPEQEVQHGQ